MKLFHLMLWALILSELTGCTQSKTNIDMPIGTSRELNIRKYEYNARLWHWASNIRIIRASCSKRQFNLLVYAALCMDKIPSRESGFANIPKATAGTSLVVQCGRT